MRCAAHLRAGPWFRSLPNSLNRLMHSQRSDFPIRFSWRQAVSPSNATVWTGRHRGRFFDVCILYAESRVPLAIRKLLHAVGNDVGERVGTSEKILLAQRVRKRAEQRIRGRGRSRSIERKSTPRLACRFITFTMPFPWRRITFRTSCTP